MANVKVTELEKLEQIIVKYKTENDMKRKHVIYLSLIDEGLKLVRRIASGIYISQSIIQKDDLIQVGAMGLLNSIEAYDLKIQGSFKTYATKVIRGKILHYIRDKGNIIKTPRETLLNISKIKTAIKELSTNASEVPEAKEIANLISLPVEKVEELLGLAVFNIVSLDQNLYTVEGGEALVDSIQTKDELSYEETYENKKILEYAINLLPRNDKTAIYMYYIKDATRKEIADFLNVSQTQVSRILKRALNKLYLIILRDLENQDKI